MKKNITFVIFLLASVLTVDAQTAIIAHRGYWDCEGSAQNSITSLQKAQKMGIYGSEFDVFITSDNVAVVNHDDKINGLKIEETPYSELKTIQLSNGEYLPTLQAYLKAGKADKKTKLILELKSHSTQELEDKAVQLTLNRVNTMGLKAQVEYISFSLNICKEIHRLEPQAKIAYLSGDLDPQSIKDLGLSGIDYHYSVILKNKEWVAEAHQLGLTVNVWTVNSEEILKEMLNLNVDFVTTDKPLDFTHEIRITKNDINDQTCKR